MGKIAKQVHTNTKVAEQVLNKTCTITSSMVNFFVYYDQFPEEGREYIMEKYFDFLSPETQKVTLSSKKSTLSPSEVNLLSHFIGEELPLDTPVHQINKIRLSKFTVSTNEYSSFNNENTNNQYFKSKDGKYYIIYNIVQFRESVYLFCDEYIQLMPYPVSDSLTFSHIKHTKRLSNNTQILLSNVIESPISVIFFNGNYVLFDLFNRHI